MAEADGASEASTKVQEAAASVQQVARKRKRISGSKAEAVARRYFEAIDARDLQTVVSMWGGGGHEHVRGQGDTLAPRGVRGFLGGPIEAGPGLPLGIVFTTTPAERLRVAQRL